VAALFGPGEVTQHADAAAGALHRRSHESFLARPGSEVWQRKQELQSFEAYREAADQALKAAHDRVRSAALDRLDSPSHRKNRRVAGRRGDPMAGRTLLA
jgi:hypothetical protein